MTVCVCGWSLINVATSPFTTFFLISLPLLHLHNCNIWTTQFSVRTKSKPSKFSTRAGYIGDDEATAATLDSEGWLKTGDLCYFDQNGFLFIVDRLKELIKYKAYQVLKITFFFLNCSCILLLLDLLILTNWSPTSFRCPLLNWSKFFSPILKSLMLLWSRMLRFLFYDCIAFLFLKITFALNNYASWGWISLLFFWVVDKKLMHF